MMIFMFLMSVAIGGGAFMLGRVFKSENDDRLLEGKVDTEVNRRLHNHDVVMLGPRGPEGVQTVVQRLREMGFVVANRLLTPRPHMLQWIYVVPSLRDNVLCQYCNTKLSTLYEVQEVNDTTCSVEDALLVIAQPLGVVCNSCGMFWIGPQDARKHQEHQLTTAPGVFGALLAKADSCNLFDIMDHIQKSRPMSERLCKYLAERRQLLEREAGKIGTALTRHELRDAHDLLSDPYRTQAALSEHGNLPRLKLSTDSNTVQTRDLHMWEEELWKKDK